MNLYRSRTQGGFTLIEILVAIVIISLLASVVFAALQGARARGRDTARVSDLSQAITALRLYAEANGTFEVEGGGNNGQGWFTFERAGSGYEGSIAEILFEEGYLPAVIHDPLVPPNSLGGGDGQRPYMHYFQEGGAQAGSCMFANLENPTEEQSATFANAPITDGLRTTLENNYSMNYAVCT